MPEEPMTITIEIPVDLALKVWKASIRNDDLSLATQIALKLFIFDEVENQCIIGQ